MVDIMIVGADRIAANGDVDNKIGTLEKAIVADRYGIPFYVAAPLSTFDPASASGNDIPIEMRSAEEVMFVEGPGPRGSQTMVRVTNPGSEVLNPAFDVTPASLVTGIITEKGIIGADRISIEEILKE
jgi:methylthioribose-1-phosphate isomerase